MFSLPQSKPTVSTAPSSEGAKFLVSSKKGYKWLQKDYKTVTQGYKIVTGLWVDSHIY